MGATPSPGPCPGVWRHHHKGAKAAGLTHKGCPPHPGGPGGRRRPPSAAPHTCSLSGLGSETETYPRLPPPPRRRGQPPAGVWKQRKPLPAELGDPRVSVCTDVCTRVHVLHVCVRRCACVHLAVRVPRKQVGSWRREGTVHRQEEARCGAGNRHHQPRTGPCSAWGCSSRIAATSEQRVCGGLGVRSAWSTTHNQSPQGHCL